MSFITKLMSFWPLRPCKAQGKNIWRCFYEIIITILIVELIYVKSLTLRLLNNFAITTGSWKISLTVCNNCLMIYWRKTCCRWKNIPWRSNIYDLGHSNLLFGFNLPQFIIELCFRPFEFDLTFSAFNPLIFICFSLSYLISDLLANPHDVEIATRWWA